MSHHVRVVGAFLRRLRLRTIVWGLGAIIVPVILLVGLHQYVTHAFAQTERIIDGLQTLYTFQEGSGSVVNDVSGVGTPLNLTIGDSNAVTWLAGGGLSIDSETIIASTGAATKVISATQSSDEITIEVWMQPADDTQDGPARVVTLSERGLVNINFGEY